MSDDKVVSIHGQPLPPQGENNERTIAALREALEEAEAGEVIGIGLVKFHADNCASFRLSGWAGSYSMLGACDRLKQEILTIAQLSEEEI